MVWRVVTKQIWVKCQFADRRWQFRTIPIYQFTLLPFRLVVEQELELLVGCHHKTSSNFFDRKCSEVSSEMEWEKKKQFSVKHLKTDWLFANCAKIPSSNSEKKEKKIERKSSKLSSTSERYCHQPFFFLLLLFSKCFFEYSRRLTGRQNCKHTIQWRIYFFEKK